MNKSTVTSFIINLITLSAAVFAAGIISLKNSGNSNSLNDLYFLGTLFAVSAMLFHLAFIWFFEKYPSRFVAIFMGLTMLKLLIYLSVVLVYIFKMESGIKLFLIMFLGLYISYSAFEVFQLIKHLKNKQDGGLNK